MFIFRRLKMRKFFHTLIVSSIFLFPVLSYADNTAIDDGSDHKIVTTTPAPVAGDIKGLKDDAATDVSAAKPALTKEDKVDKLIGVGISKVIGKDAAGKLSDDNQKLATATVKTAFSNFSIEAFKDAKQTAVSRAQEELDARVAQGLTNSPRRTFFTGLKFGTLEGLKLVAKATFSVAREHGVQIAVAVLAAV